ncbi:MAG: thioredoxin domain-containing protein [Bryobacteraceae bacterium]|jgi:thiol-disulfide isomerase/thioredoxin
MMFRALVVALTFAASAAAQPKWFAPDEPSRLSLAEALASAQKSNHRLIVVYDGSWCTHCAELHTAAMADPDVPNLVHSGYEITMVKTDNVDDLARFAKETLHAKLDKSDGLLITILDKDGSLLTTLTAARVMDKGQLAPAKLKAQLSEFLISIPADQVYRQGLASLPAGKAAWVEFRADWCGWCKKMESFFQASEAAPVLARYYSVVTIDTEKNEGSDALARKLGASKGVDGGIPWFAVVDADGKVLANSEGPKGNIGYPDTDVEVTYFTSVLKSTAKGISDAEVESVLNTIKTLKAAAATSH